MFRSRVYINLPSQSDETAITWGDWFRSIFGLDPIAARTHALNVTACTLLDRMVTGFQFAGINNAILFQMDDDVLYYDQKNIPDDLDHYHLSILQDKRIWEPFERMILAVSVETEDFHLVLEATIKRRALVTEEELILDIVGRPHHAQKQPNETFEAYSRRLHERFTGEDWNQDTEAFTAEVRNIEDCLYQSLQGLTCRSKQPTFVIRRPTRWEQTQLREQIAAETIESTDIVESTTGSTSTTEVFTEIITESDETTEHQTKGPGSFLDTISRFFSKLTGSVTQTSEDSSTNPLAIRPTRGHSQTAVPRGQDPTPTTPQIDSPFGNLINRGNSLNEPPRSFTPRPSPIPRDTAPDLDPWFRFFDDPFGTFYLLHIEIDISLNAPGGFDFLEFFWTEPDGKVLGTLADVIDSSAPLYPDISLDGDGILQFTDAFIPPESTDYIDDPFGLFTPPQDPTPTPWNDPFGDLPTDDLSFDSEDTGWHLDDFFRDVLDLAETGSELLESNESGYSNDTGPDDIPIDTDPSLEDE